MTDYPGEIERIRSASTLEDVQGIVREFSAKSSSEGGVLYSGKVGDLNSSVVAREIAAKAGIPIIDQTPRGRFLGQKLVETELHDAAERIFVGQGQSLAQAEKSAAAFLYGDSEAPAHSLTSVERCLWGEASKEFSGSLRGNVVVVASTASADRVLGRVEIPTGLNNFEITSLGGQPIAKVQAAYAQGGSASVLPEIQARFIQAAPRGIFIASDAIGRTPAQAILSREFATTLDLDASRFTPAGELSASGNVVRASIGMSTAVSADEVILARSAVLRTPIVSEVLAGTATPGSPAARVHGSSALSKGLGAAGVAATAYDALTSSTKADDLRSQGSVLAAQSELNHFVGRNVGGWAGAIAGVELGVATFGKTPQSAVIGGVVGGVVGATAGERIANLEDAKRIYNQTDRDGVDWRFNGRQWLREQSADLTRDHVDNPQNQLLAALPEKTQELSYRATNAAVDLASRDAPRPEDPYRLKASSSDGFSLEQADWRRDSRSGQWHRDVVSRIEPPDMPVVERESATPTRAAELDALSVQTIAANIANGPAAAAARYELSYRHHGWDAHGPMPSQVQAALSGADSLQASNGRHYTRGNDGSWDHDGSAATGNTLLELDATREALLPALAQHADAMAQVQPRAPLAPHAQDRANLAATYASFRIAPNVESLDAVMIAVQRTRDAHGIDPATTSLSPLANGSGGYDIGSPLAHLASDPQGVVRMVATTSAEEIQQARDEIRARGEGQPQRDADARDTPEPASSTNDPSQAPSHHLDPAATAASASPTQPFASEAHPQHAMYALLKAHLPQDTSEGRLAQFTSECHCAGIRPHTLSSIEIDGPRAVFVTMHGWPRAEVDMGGASPPTQDSARKAEAQSHEADQAQQQARTAPAHQAPVMEH